MVACSIQCIHWLTTVSRDSRDLYEWFVLIQFLPNILSNVIVDIDTHLSVIIFK